MPWSKKQVKVAQAVKHGWQPTGSAAGFTPKFADEVVTESGGKNLGKLMGVSRKGRRR